MKIREIKDNLKITRLGNFIMTIRRNNRGRTKKHAYKIMQRYGYESISDEEKKQLYRKMQYCSHKYHFNYSEFFLLGLQDKNEEEIYGYISDSEHITICEALNNPKNQYIFDDKSITSEYFSDYFGRESILFESKKDWEKLKKFLIKHKEIIVKPLSSACGQGVKKVVIGNNVDKTVSDIISNYCSGVLGETVRKLG